VSVRCPMTQSYKLKLIFSNDQGSNLPSKSGNIYIFRGFEKKS
jgi:hypothetical protein